MFTMRQLSVLMGAVVFSLAACAAPELSAPPTKAPVRSVSPTHQQATSSPSVVETPPPDESPTPSPSSSPILTPEDVTTGLDAPWSVVFREGVPLVSERDSGRILEISDDGSIREVGIVDGVRAGGEGGLLGLAVDDGGRLYAYFTTAHDNRIVSFDVSGAAGSLALGEPRIILEGLKKSSTHNGGRIAFGPDDMLYATVGDAGSPQRAQDLQSLSGKILRMTADGDVPPDNPFDGSLVWSLGHRNPQGIAWAEDSTMFATEFGQDTWDELNVIEPGKNYGWPEVEGIAETQEFTNPVQQWSPADASPSGMAYTDGTLYIANLRGRVLRTVAVADPSTSSERWDEEYGRLRHVVAAPDGQLWVLTNNTDGRGQPAPGDDRIIRISPVALNE